MHIISGIQKNYMGPQCHLCSSNSFLDPTANLPVPKLWTAHVILALIPECHTFGLFCDITFLERFLKHYLNFEKKNSEPSC